jgi:hypothetical protein
VAIVDPRGLKMTLPVRIMTVISDVSVKNCLVCRMWQITIETTFFVTYEHAHTEWSHTTVFS